MRVLVTGGCGFIGSHVVRALVGAGSFVTNLDLLTYAGNPANVADIEGHPRYRFVHGDICDMHTVKDLVAESDVVVNLAAETHVDRSIASPASFVQTDVGGVVCLLEAIRETGRAHLVHMSTDEVFGSLPFPEAAGEDTPFNPTSPYSASKAGAELQLRSHAATYGMSITVLRCCNVYGPNQHVEKFVPLFVTRAFAREPMPLYGDGLHEREWLHVHDVATAVQLIAGMVPFQQPGLTAVHVGSGRRIPNLTVARMICALTGCPADLITHVDDRPGHDRRYAIESARLRSLGWSPRISFEEGIASTVAWYAANAAVWGQAVSDEHLAFSRRQYGDRLRRAGAGVARRLQ